MYCSRCGHPNRDDARYCARCGAQLQGDTTLSLTPVEAEEDVGEEVPAPRDELRPGQALLLVKRGPNAGSTYLIESDVTTTGRRPESDVFLDDVTVSRNPATIHRRGDAFFVHDEGSLNGTYGNGERVEETRLAPGDEIQIGMFKLAFFAAEE